MSVTENPYSVALTNASSPYAVTSVNDLLYLCDASSGSVTVSLPPSASNRGRNVHVKKTDSSGNAVILDPDGSETVDGAATFSLYAQNEAAMVMCDGTGWRLISHNAGSRMLRVLNLIDQTASIATANLFASAPVGMYRVTWYLVTSLAGVAGTVLLTIGWTDAIQAQTMLTTTIALSALGAAISGTTVLNSAASQNITYATTMASVVGSPKYNLYLRLEAM